jgi:molybdopterin synthase sulfur carrier subunit
MKVTVKVFATLRDIMERETDIDVADGTTVSQLLQSLCDRYGKLRSELFESSDVLKPYINILKNGRNISFLKDLDTRLDDGDQIAIFPPVAGG